MCRIAAYVGPPQPLSSLLYDPPHSLESQAYRPRELVHGTVNVDGTGVAWWSDGHPEPLRYVGAASPWADPNLAHLSRRLSGRTILAAVRSATPGLAFGPDHVAPFTHGRLAGAHNGRIQGFRGLVGKEMVAELRDEQWADLAVANDSRALFLMVAAHYRGDTSDAVRAGVRDLHAILDAHDASAELNLVVADGTSMAAVRHSVRAPVNSMYWAARGDSHLVASEPLDETPEWKPVPEGHLLSLTPDSVSSSPLE